MTKSNVDRYLKGEGHQIALRCEQVKPSGERLAMVNTGAKVAKVSFWLTKKLNTIKTRFTDYETYQSI